MPEVLSLSSACARAGVAVGDRFTLAEVAAVLGLPLPTLRRLVRSRALSIVRFTARGGFVLADDLADGSPAFLSSLTRGTLPVERGDLTASNEERAFPAKRHARTENQNEPEPA